MRENFAGNAPWEPIVGYSRCVRVDRMIFVSGTTATNERGELVGIGDPYAQAKQALANIRDVLARAGAAMTDVVRTRTYVTDISRWEEVGRAHGEVFGDIRPAATLVGINRLVHPDMLVEIEVDAIVAELR